MEDSVVGLVLVGALGLLVLFTLSRAVRIVPQARAGIVERLGRYSRTLGPGVTLLVPFFDRLRPLIDLREQVVSFPPQPVITADNLVVGIDTVLYFQVTDAKSATYEIENYIQAVEQLTVTTLRNVVGSLNLEGSDLLTPREAEVLELLQDGATNGQIAQRLSIGIETVRTHARNIYRKLGVSSRRELARLSKPEAVPAGS